MAGLKKADIIMTISKFSRDEIVKYLNYPEDKIHIVSAAVDQISTIKIGIKQF